MTTEVQEATKSYRFHHTMLRVKDPVKSRAFYENGLGMKLLGKFDYEQVRYIHSK
jgi:lactoylglutathione lyase